MLRSWAVSLPWQQPQPRLHPTPQSMHGLPSEVRLVIFHTAFGALLRNGPNLKSLMNNQDVGYRSIESRPMFTGKEGVA